jgi:7,8-dihydropterin-6-yl-methyl-4-(beta-D-ribofuranosyl)aminobenzene 5'-phosphate synthase
MKTKILVVAFLLACIPTIGYAQNADDPRVILEKVKSALTASLDSIDHQLTKASDELSVAGIASPEARTIIDTLCRSNKFIVDCATVDPEGKMLLVEPQEYRKFAGVNISKQEHMVWFRKDKKPAFSNIFRSAEGLDAVDFEYPVLTTGGELTGSVSMLVRPDRLLDSIISPILEQNQVEVWVMQKDGVVLYDEEVDEVGQNVFTGEVYRSFPEFRVFCEKVTHEKQGSGIYQSFVKGLSRFTEKDAVWDTVSIHGLEWRIIAYVVHPTHKVPAAKKNDDTTSASTKITILSENYTCGLPGIKTERGFSVLIEKDGEQYLYDTGQSGACVDNAAVLGKDLKKTSIIFFSHGHLDHTGGVEQVLRAIGHPVEIIAHPAVFSNKYKIGPAYGKVFIGVPFRQEYLEGMFKAKFNFQAGFYKVRDGVWLTGEIPLNNMFEKIPEESRIINGDQTKKDTLPDDNTLVLETSKGLVVLLGCGHRGIVNILEYIEKNLPGKKIYAVIGGAHLYELDKKRIDFVKGRLRPIFERNQTKLFAPGHCTGLRIVDDLWFDFKDILSYASCGTSFEF